MFYFRFYPREPEPNNLLHTDICPVQTTITVERHPTTGKLLGYKEVRNLLQIIGAFDNSSGIISIFHVVGVVVALLFYVLGKHLRSCRDGQLT